MLKFLSVSMLLGAVTPCFSTPNFPGSTPMYGITLHKDCSSYLKTGNQFLLEGDSYTALLFFNTASAYLDKTDTSSYIFDFLISLGQVVAHDHQGDRTKCKQAIGSLFLSINRWANDEEALLNSDSESDCSVTSRRDSYSKNDYLELEDFLADLISMAPSDDIRQLLTDTAAAVTEDLYPYFNAFRHAL